MTDQPTALTPELDAIRRLIDPQTRAGIDLWNRVYPLLNELALDRDRLRGDLATAREALAAVTVRADRAGVLIAQEALDRIGEQ